MQDLPDGVKVLIVSILDFSEKLFWTWRSFSKKLTNLLEELVADRGGQYLKLHTIHPFDFCEVFNLEELLLSNNQLTGPFLRGWEADESHHERVDDNRLTGSFLQEIGQLANLKG